MTTKASLGRSIVLPFVFGSAAILLGSSGLAIFAEMRAEAVGRLVVRNPSVVWQMDRAVGTKSGRYAVGRFEMANVGGKPVRVASASSSCGCAAPKVNPGTIEPGAVGFVEVEAIPLLSGEKSATIVLRTDSPLTPEIELHLRMIGARRPPYLMQAGGDLTYLGDFERDEPHTVVVITVEPREQSGLPLLRTDFPGMEFGAPVVKERPHVAPGTIQREYRFPVSFARMPPEGVFTGAAEVVDPWDPGHTEVVHIHGQVLLPFRVEPRRIILNGPRDHQSFRIISRTDVDGRRLGIQADGGSGLVVERVDRGEDRRSFTFTVGHRDDARFVPGVHKLIVRSPNNPENPVVLPVSVREETPR
ncbi:MAG TPA: DUF1573 domain-containing protein [Isosphaeraceae bacterium]|jgi:hypothetical protein|nr:DUF1573 domain-containing protein [Isosphaeraceae bacterium]